MSRTQAVLLLLTSLAFTAAGAVIALRGGADDRAAGLACGVFFAACSVVFTGELLPRRLPVPDVGGVVLIHRDRIQTGVLAVGGALMGAGCALLAPLAAAQGDVVMTAVAWGGAAFFGLAAPIGLWRLARGRPLYRLDPEGIAQLDGDRWMLRWRDIAAIEPFAMGGQRWLALQPGPGVAARPGAVARVTDAAGLPAYAVSALGARLDFEVVAALVMDYWTRGRDR
ncbi:MAG: STM3941 family protein [Hyphomonadaceae bacterium]|nr:STM3941 family protein [Hyphomonadaceae bacterium]